MVDTQGDSFFVAFRTAADAVAAAVDAQRDLTAYAWPEGAEIKVRMGLHTGEPKVGAERYVGIGVHRAARIGAAGHGGQVLLSWTTKGLAEEDLPAGVTIRDLGERRLKDIEQPQRLYQLVIDGLVSEFGPLKTLDVELDAQATAHVRRLGVDRRAGGGGGDPGVRARPGRLRRRHHRAAQRGGRDRPGLEQGGRSGAERGRATKLDRVRLRIALGRQPGRRDGVPDRPEDDSRHEDLLRRGHAYGARGVSAGRVGGRLDPNEARRSPSRGSIRGSTASASES